MKIDLDRIRKIIAGTTDDVERGSLAVLLRSYQATRQAYADSPTVANLKNWTSAERELIERIDAADPAAAAKGPALKNILAVVDHLTALGWKIRKSAAYKARKEGKIRPRPDGSYLAADAERYAETFLRRIDGGPSADEQIERLQQEKQAAETEKIKAQARHWSMKASILEGRYVEKGLFERELARRAAVFKNDIENFCRAQAAGIISLVAGDAAKTPDLIEHMLGQSENWLGRYAEEREFRIPEPAAESETIEDDGDDDGGADDDEGINYENA